MKFYFHLPGQPYNGSHYVGPNVSDSFERKTRRLIDHQLPLSQIHHPEVNRRIGLMKGRIYYQADLKAQPEYPDLMSTDHLRGRWTYASEVAELERFRADSFLVLRKPHWLTFDPNSESLNRLQIQKVIKDHFTHRKFPIHIAIVREGIEIERLFVVADTWPDD